MTEIICIGASKHLVPIYERLQKDSTVLKEHEAALEMALKHDGAYQLLECQLAIPENTSQVLNNDGLKICLHQIAEAVAENIVIWWKPELVRTIMYEKYDNLSNEELDSILRKMYQASLEKTIYIQLVTTALDWKKEIASRIVHFLEAGNMLSVDGFINFRLQDFKLEIEQLVDDAVEEYMLEKEYDDFIDLLRYFVNTQEPRLKKVHVVLSSSGSFNMFDKNYKHIDNEFLEGFILDLMDNDLTYEDLLVSALITIAPLEIVLHLPVPVNDLDTAISTIQSVFEERVTTCIGCSKCQNISIKKL